MSSNTAKGILVAVLLSAAFIASAQNVDHKIFGIESGVVFGYDLSTGNLGNGSMVTLNMTLTDSMTAGFTFLNGTAPMPVTASILSLNYGLADKFGFSLALGRDTTAATLLTGLGLYFNVFERKVQDTLATVMKTRVEYLFNPNGGLTTGDLTIGMSVSVGI